MLESELKDGSFGGDVSECTSVPRAKTVGNQLETAQYRQLEQIKGFSGSRTECQHDKSQ